VHDDVVASEERFRAVYAEHVRAVAAFVLRRIPAAVDAEDVVAETFLVVWRRFGEAPRDMRPWLFGVARMVLFNHYRGEQRRDALSARLAEAHTRLGGESADQGWLVDALRGLREGDREVVALIAWEGLSHSEAARVLGCSPGAVAIRLHRARRRLEAARPSSTPTAIVLRRSDT
jgi:RNA polymerase sigma-70 factor (ECF subfamily)